MCRVATTVRGLAHCIAQRAPDCHFADLACQIGRDQDAVFERVEFGEVFRAAEPGDIGIGLELCQQRDRTCDLTVADLCADRFEYTAMQRLVEIIGANQARGVRIEFVVE